MVQAADKNDISILEMSKIASYNFRSIYRKEFYFFTKMTFPFWKCQKEPTSIPIF